MLSTQQRNFWDSKPCRTPRPACRVCAACRIPRWAQTQWTSFYPIPIRRSFFTSVTLGINRRPNDFLAANALLSKTVEQTNNNTPRACKKMRPSLRYPETLVYCFSGSSLDCPRPKVHLFLFSWRLIWSRRVCRVSSGISFFHPCASSRCASSTRSTKSLSLKTARDKTTLSFWLSCKT